MAVLDQMTYSHCDSPATVVEAAGTTIARTTAHEYELQGKRWKTTTPEGSMSTNHSHVLILQERNAGHTPQVQYTRGLDISGTIEGAGGIGGLLMRSHDYSSGNWSSHNAYHSDANGNVTALMNSSGVLQASYKYNPYGGLISSSGTLAGANTMRFSSKPAILSATGAWGFYYYGYRFYDPGMQRWLNRDPLGEVSFEVLRKRRAKAVGDGPNFYTFVRNTPINGCDAIGLACRGHCAPPAPSPIRKCNRKIENDDNDLVIGIANIRGHDYFDWSDGSGGRDGVGLRDPNARDGDHPQSESGSQARHCYTCYKSWAVLKHGSGAGKSGTSASFDEVKECLKSRPIKGDYGGLMNNCNDWASDAAKDCGLNCP